MHLHREGRNIILLISILLIILIISVFILPVHLILKGIITLPFIVLYVLIYWFFRIPVRNVVINENLIYAPADGKIVAIEETKDEEYFYDKRVQISIFMSPLNIHQNTYPISGKVMYTKYHKGKYLVAWHPKSSTKNERATIVIKHKNGTEILVRQIAGAVARRICTYASKGNTVMQGNELGFIKFGSRVDVLVPLNAKIMCRINHTTVSGITPLAEF